MERKDIEVTGINAYELQEQFDENARKPLQELRSEIEEQYAGDGETAPEKAGTDAVTTDRDV